MPRLIFQIENNGFIFVVAALVWKLWGFAILHYFFFLIFGLFPLFLGVGGGLLQGDLSLSDVGGASSLN